jgi:hypothetical protein
LGGITVRHVNAFIFNARVQRTLGDDLSIPRELFIIVIIHGL